MVCVARFEFPPLVTALSNADRAEIPGFAASPVDRIKPNQKIENTASLRDASNTVDAYSPRVSAQRPTAKEMAAARAARIRLGYEVDDSGSRPEVKFHWRACSDHC